MTSRVLYTLGDIQQAGIKKKEQEYKAGLDQHACMLNSGIHSFLSTYMHGCHCGRADKIPEGVLNKAVSDEHIIEISTFLESWKLVGPHLDLSQGEIEAVERDGKTEAEKRLLTLQKWKQVLFFKATYKKLVEALLTVRRTDQAGKVCQICHNTQSQGRVKHIYMCHGHAGNVFQCIMHFASS